MHETLMSYLTLLLRLTFLVEEDDDCAVSEMEDLPHVPYRPQGYSEKTMLERSKQFYRLMNERRSVRYISPEPVPREVIDYVIRTAGKFYTTLITSRYS